MAPRAARALAVAGSLWVAATACADDGPQSPGTAALGVVSIEIWRCDEPNRFSGHGVNVDGRIVTAAHLVDGRVREVLVDGEPATVASVDERTDLATLHLAASGATVRPASVVDVVPRQLDPARRGPLVSAGDQAWLLTAHAVGGSADDGANDQASGTIRRRPVDIVRETRLVVNDVSAETRVERDAIVFSPGVDEGTSGAPLVTASGRLIGIVVLTSRSGERAYAVRADEVSGVVARSRRAHGALRAETPGGTGSSAAVCDRW